MDATNRPHAHTLPLPLWSADPVLGSLHHPEPHFLSFLLSSCRFPPCSADTMLYDVLKVFRFGRSHMACLTRPAAASGRLEVVGVITIEDVLEVRGVGLLWMLGCVSVWVGGCWRSGFGCGCAGASGWPAALFCLAASCPAWLGSTPAWLAARLAALGWRAGRLAGCPAAGPAPTLGAAGAPAAGDCG